MALGRFESVAPLLRASTAVVYLFAGFHKLNRDFLFEPQVSCAGGFFDGLARQWVGVGLQLPPALIVALAVGVVLLELGLAVALLLPSPTGLLRRGALIAAWSLHAVLALGGFFDFSALMFALLWSFVPPKWIESPEVMRRAKWGLAIVLCASALSGLAAGHRVMHLLQGASLIVMLVLVALPILRAWRTPPSTSAQSHTGAAVVPVPRMLWMFPALLALFASSNYLGLRTAGTFSMFSNLRTEGGRSNHLLVPARHPLLFADHAADLIWIDSLDPRARLIPESQSVIGLGVPRIELARHLARWEAEGLGEIRATVRDAHGVRHDVPDLARAEAVTGALRTEAWKQRLLDFRPVQPESHGPNRCRW